LLDKAAKGLDIETEWCDTYSAREMSTFFLVQEEVVAATLEHKLETESFAKHRELLNENELVQKSLEIFDVWNMSSLTRL
jgi:hypothetical protein